MHTERHPDKYLKICASKSLLFFFFNFIISVHSFFLHMECYNISKSLKKTFMIIRMATDNTHTQTPVCFLCTSFLSTAVRMKLDQIDHYLMEFGSTLNKQTEKTLHLLYQKLLTVTDPVGCIGAQICWKQTFAQNSKIWKNIIKKLEMWIYYLIKWYVIKGVLQVVW